MNRYEQAWKRFVSGGYLEFGGHMDPKWKDGHALSASLMVPVDVSRLHDRIEPLREALKTQPFVSLHPDHFMHITLLMLGFLVPEPVSENEVSHKRLREIENESREALESFPAFSIELANLNAFPGAAFIEVYDGGKLDELRDAVCKNCGLKSAGGLSHLTLAYFQAPDNTPVPEGLISTISRFREWPVGEVLVDGVDLTLLDLNQDYPEPERLARMPLAGD